jgi:hypothetical protein
MVGCCGFWLRRKDRKAGRATGGEDVVTTLPPSLLIFAEDALAVCGLGAKDQGESEVIAASFPKNRRE